MNQFVKGFGFSKGCAELALKKPPPLLPSVLDGLLEPTGPPGMVWCAPDRVVRSRSGWRLWIAPPAIRIMPPTIASGISSRTVVAGVSTQKLPSLSVLRPGEAADQRDRDDHADSRGHELLHGKAGHLGQIAHGGLAGVVLPVGVRDERRRGVPGSVRRHVGHALAVEQVVLQPLEAVQEQHADRGERQHAADVGAPLLVGLGVNPHQP